MRYIIQNMLINFDFSIKIYMILIKFKTFPNVKDAI